MAQPINDLVNLRLRSVELALTSFPGNKPFDVAKDIENFVKEGIELENVKDETDRFMNIVKEIHKNSSNSNMNLSQLPTVKLNVKIKKLSEDAVIPTYAKHGDAGMDLTAISYNYKSDIDCHVFGTGLAIEIPEGFVGLIFPRSSNRKTDAFMCNHVGVIDSGYRGEVMVSFKNRDKQYEVIQQLIAPYAVGNKIAQLIILPYPKVDFEEVKELSDSKRGTDGHGSTGM